MIYLDALIAYYRGQLELIMKNYSLARESQDPDGVHDLRVALKRMKALFNLISSLNDSFPAKKRFKIFKAVSRNTCLLRDAQVQLILADKAKKDTDLEMDGYRMFLEGKEKAGITLFLEFAATDPLAGLADTEDHLIKALKWLHKTTVQTKAFGRLFNLRNELALAVFEQPLRNSKLHPLRILAKETHYTYEMVSQCIRPLAPGQSFFPGIKKVHGVLGDWHDFDVSLQFLKEFAALQVDSAGRLKSRSIETYLRGKKTALKRRLPGVLREFDSVSRRIAYLDEKK